METPKGNATRENYENEMNQRLIACSVALQWPLGLAICEGNWRRGRAVVERREALGGGGGALGVVGKVSCCCSGQNPQHR